MYLKRLAFLLNKSARGRLLSEILFAQANLIRSAVENPDAATPVMACVNCADLRVL